MDRKLLGKRIREERMRIGLTQEQIAEYIDVSTTYIGLVERGGAVRHPGKAGAFGGMFPCHH